MPGPLLPLLANTLGRLVSANVTRSVAGAVSRAAATRGGQAAAAASPSSAATPFQYVMRTIGQRSRRRSARTRRWFSRNTPGLAQANQWQRVKRAFRGLERARSAKHAALQIGDPLKVQRAEEQEEAAKQKLAMETRVLLESFTGLKRGVMGAVVALHTLPHAVQAIGRAHVDFIRSRSGVYSGRTAGALARYDINERLSKIHSAQATAPSDVRFVNATQALNQEMKPLSDAMHTLSTEVLTEVVRGTTLLISVIRTFSPLVRAVESLAKHFQDKDGKAKDDITTAMFKELIQHTRAQTDHARREWKEATRPPNPQGKR